MKTEIIERKVVDNGGDRDVNDVDIIINNLRQ